MEKDLECKCNESQKSGCGFAEVAIISLTMGMLLHGCCDVVIQGIAKIMPANSYAAHSQTLKDNNKQYGGGTYDR